MWGGRKVAADPSADTVGKDVEAVDPKKEKGGGDSPSKGESACSGSEFDAPAQPKGATALRPSLDELNRSVAVPPADASWHKKLLAFAGMGGIVAVGYMDPGNWATDIAGGAAYGYTLLSVVLFSSILAMFLQFLSLKLGAATDMDLAQACHSWFTPAPNFLLWIVTEIAIAATDLVGVLGCATALNLLFGLPVWAGVLLTAFDVILLLFIFARSIRLLELMVLVLCVFIAGALIYQLVLARPVWGDVFFGFVPQGEVFHGAIYPAVAILGATVMPHNLYLHSSLVQTREFPRTVEGRKMAVTFATVDSTISLFFAFFVNCAILILAAAAFHYGRKGMQDIADINDAYHLISPILGADAARILFGVALLAAGQNSSISGTLAGQIVMEGFVELKLQPWVRRLTTRLFAIIPAVIVAAVSGPKGTGRLLVLSQVILSVQLPFAIGPLVYFTSSRAVMGSLANSWLTTGLAWAGFIFVTGLNGYLVVDSIVHLAQR